MKTILTKLNENVNKYGDKIALKSKNKQLTYKELNIESNKIAKYLLENGLKEKEYVSIYLTRDVDTLIAFYGVLKAGGIYVPLDPSHPIERTKYIMNNVSSQFVLTTKNLVEKVDSLNILLMDDLDSLPYDDTVYLNDKLEDVLYVLFTSGTTGNPKGTLVRQQGIANLMDYIIPAWNYHHSDIVLQFSNYSFDASVLDTYSALYSSSTLYLIDDTDRMSEEAFLNVVKNEKITMMPSIPTVFFNRIIKYANDNDLKSFYDVKLVGVGGELLTGDLSRKFKETIGKNVQFFNLYGPTEATVMVSGFEVPHNLDKKVFSTPIGKEFPNTKLYLVNEQGQLCENGEIGEIWIAGTGIAVGYLNNEEKTNEVFVPNTFEPSIFEGKVYKTGDLAKRLDSGDIEFVSRKDNQVKIRGQRIEIAEIETRMNEFEDINDTVVVVETVNDDKLLKAFFTSDKEQVNYAEIINYLKTLLPNYMIPSKLKQIDAIPFTPNKKADRKLLEKMDADKIIIHHSEIVEPKNDIEMNILNVWKEILQTNEIGTTDDFFDVGGHSLKIIEILSELKINYPMLTIKDFFDLKTVKNLALKVKESTLNYNEFKEGYIHLNELPKIHVENTLKEPQNILVTGATGFLGSHIVFDLINNKKNVTVLVRGHNGIERFKNKFKDYFNSEPKNVSYVQGELVEKQFGLSQIEFNKLAYNLDAIIHTAADVRHFGQREEFSLINVEGTKNVFDLVEINNEIVFHHISTVGILEDLLNENKWNDVEKYNKIPEETTLENVYTDTKLEAEKFILSKVKENKEVFIYRMGNLTGRYSDGYFQQNIHENAFYRSLKLMISTNKSPMVQWKIDFTPIDFASKVVVQSVLKTDNKERVYHVSHPNPIEYTEFINILNELDFNIKIKSKEEYNQFILKTDDKEIKELAVTQLDGDGIKDSNAIYDSKHTMNILDIKNIPSIDKIYLNKLLEHAEKVGFLKKSLSYHK